MCIRDSYNPDYRNFAPRVGLAWRPLSNSNRLVVRTGYGVCLLYTSDAADERSSVDLGGRRIIKKKKNNEPIGNTSMRRTKYIKDRTNIQHNQKTT